MIRTMTVAATAALLIPGAVSAQDDYLRAGHKKVAILKKTGATPAGVDSFIVAVEPNFSATATAEVSAAMRTPVEPGEWDLSGHDYEGLDFHRIGGMQLLSDTELLVSGTKIVSQSPFNQEGRLVRVSATATIGGMSLQILETQAIGEIDPYEVAWNKNANLLYVIDYRTRSLMAAPWDGTQPLPQESDFAVRADMNGPLGDVLSPVAFAYLSIPGVHQPLQGYGGVRIIAANRATGAHYYVKEVSGAMVINPLDPGRMEDGFTPVGDRTVFGPNLPLTLDVEQWSLGSVPVALADALDGTILDQTTVSNGSVTFSAFAQEMLDRPGRVLRVVADHSDAGGFVFRSQLRYGDPVAVAGFTPGRGRLPTRGLAQDAPFGVGVATTMDMNLTGATVTGELRIGHRSGSGTAWSDPVVTNGSTAVLNPDTVIPFTIEPGEQGPSIGHLVDLSAETVGAVLLFQYAFTITDAAGTRHATSDVFGSQVLATQVVIGDDFVDPFLGT